MNLKNIQIQLCFTLLLSICCLMTLQGYASFKPTPQDEVLFKQHAQAKTDGDIRVSCTVLTNEESKYIFDIDLASRFIQTVWLEVENDDDRPYWLLSSAIDNDYYSPDEVAYSNRFIMSEKTNEEMVKIF